MKTIATMALEPGMILADDVLNHKNELLFSKNTTLDSLMISKITHNSIMCVDIKDSEDLASTHYEKVRVSNGFKEFEIEYNKFFSYYKTVLNDLVIKKEHLEIKKLYLCYVETVKNAKTGELLLDYLYNMVPSQDEITYAHLFNSALIAGVFGTWIGLSREDFTVFISCAFLYDIGKLLLPDEILWKSGKLTDHEFEIMKTHTINGYKLISECGVDDNVLKATLQHHERCDGTGYPSRLKYDQINKFAKLISIVDAYEAMTSARTYRDPLNPFQVIANFEKTKEYYDIEVLDNVLRHIANTQLGLTVRLSDERVADVILINEKNLSRPLLKTKSQEFIDLTQFPELKITAIL